VAKKNEMVKYTNVKHSKIRLDGGKTTGKPDRVINSAIATDLLLPHSVINISRGIKKIDFPSYRNVPVEPKFHGICLLF
jgi:hypothetical protein